MGYYLCHNCHQLIKDQAYQVGTNEVGDPLYFHPTCRPSYQKEHWRDITEHSFRAWEAGGIEAWRKLDWSILELPVDQRRWLKARGYTMEQIKNMLTGYTKPLCPECDEYVWPWEEHSVTTSGNHYHHGCIIDKMVGALA